MGNLEPVRSQNQLSCPVLGTHDLGLVRETCGDCETGAKTLDRL